MAKQKINRGAEIVIKKWVNLKPKERLMIVTNDTRLNEANVLRKYAVELGSSVDIMIVEKKGMQVGMYFDENENIFDAYQAIIGATDYSLVTTRAVKRAISKKKKFLSLPLSTNNGVSMLAYDFMTMDTNKSKLMAKLMMKYTDDASFIHVTTKLGTKLKFYIRDRKSGFFNGVVKDGKGYSSASIELYIPIEENMTEGILILDGSYGYIGKVKEPFKIEFSEGRISKIENSPSGDILKEYLKSYNDENMYVASEFGIGLNSLSKCKGNCYIEDESAYGTFHIGFGRNLALGGIHEATGHFDLVTLEPNIYVDNKQIMESGKFIVPELMLY